MPENTSLPGFMSLKSRLRDIAAERGMKMSSRQAHRAAAAVAPNLPALIDALDGSAEAYGLDYADHTGETAVDRVLIQYLSRLHVLEAAGA